MLGRVVVVVVVELAGAKSSPAQAELIQAVAGNRPLGMFRREIPSCGKEAF